MAYIAHERLNHHLQSLAASDRRPTFSESAAAMLDAWSIVDSAHRFRDFVTNMPGLPNSDWKRLLIDRTEEVAELRNCAQHQLGEIPGLISDGGQLWGYLSWAAVREGKHSGMWLMMAAGSDYVGDEWFFVGPTILPFQVPNGRIRLNAFGKQVYLGRVLNAMIEAGSFLEREITEGTLRPVDLPATERRGAEAFARGAVEVSMRIDDGATKL
jgi:hypothetical protein